MKEWIIVYKMIYKKEIKDRTFTFRELANDLRKELTKLQLLKARQVIAKGAFGLSFVELEDTNQLIEDKQEKKEKGKGKSKRKLTIRESSTKCLACDIQGHILAKCLYVFLD